MSLPSLLPSFPSAAGLLCSALSSKELLVDVSQVDRIGPTALSHELGRPTCRSWHFSLNTCTQPLFNNCFDTIPQETLQSCKQQWPIKTYQAIKRLRRIHVQKTKQSRQCVKPPVFQENNTVFSSMTPAQIASTCFNPLVHSTARLSSREMCTLTWNAFQIQKFSLFSQISEMNRTIICGGVCGLFLVIGKYTVVS